MALEQPVDFSTSTESQLHDSMQLASELGITEKLADLKLATQEIFPGEVIVERETDPEISGCWYFVFRVTAQGANPTVLAQSRRKWYQRTLEMLPNHCEHLRLSIDNAS